MDTIIRCPDADVQRPPETQFCISIPDSACEISADLCAYVLAKDPEVVRGPDNEYVERLPDAPPIIRPFEDAPIERVPDNTQLERR